MPNSSSSGLLIYGFACSQQLSAKLTRIPHGCAASNLDSFDVAMQHSD